MQSRLLVLRRAGECVVCETHLPVGATAWWDGRAKTVTCATCHETKVAPGGCCARAGRARSRRRGNIDHLAVAPCGVFVIDAKRYSGKVRLADGGFRGLRLVIADSDKPAFGLAPDPRAPGPTTPSSPNRSPRCERPLSD